MHTCVAQYTVQGDNNVVHHTLGPPFVYNAPPPSQCALRSDVPGEKGRVVNNDVTDFTTSYFWYNTPASPPPGPSSINVTFYTDRACTVPLEGPEGTIACNYESLFNSQYFNPCIYPYYDTDFYNPGSKKYQYVVLVYVFCRMFSCSSLLFLGIFRPQLLNFFLNSRTIYRHSSWRSRLRTFSASVSVLSMNLATKVSIRMKSSVRPLTGTRKTGPRSFCSCCRMLSIESDRRTVVDR